MEDQDPFEEYSVVINGEEQYSIWPTEREIPAGWSSTGKVGTKAECLDHIELVWTDMRPLSLRRKMEEWANAPLAPDNGNNPNNNNANDVDEPEGPSLVDRLCAGNHRLVASLRPDRTAQALLEAIERRYVLVKFTETQGETELGMDLDLERSNVEGADFERGTGNVVLVGALNLDFEDVLCVANLDLATLDGNGRLERVAAA